MKRLIYQLAPLALLIAWLPTSAVAEEPATIVEVGARMLSRGETLDADDLITLAGASEDLRGMLDV